MVKSVSEHIPTVDLAKFEVDPERGFLPHEDPLATLPRNFSVLMKLGKELPELLQSGRLRSVVMGLHPLDVSHLRGRALQRARMIYGFLAHAYVHATPGKSAKKIPKGVAVPLHLLSSTLGIPPVLSYDVYALHNWRRKDAKAPIALGNLDVLQTFVDIPDEPWFILVHIEVEVEAAGALRAIGAAQKSVLESDADTISNSLEIMKQRLTVMKETLHRMYERNDPNLYYKSFRPYLMGFDGVIYEGVEAFRGKAQTFAGETAAQSSVIPCFDGARGVKHNPTELTDYIAIMRRYMPKPHREFIRAIEKGPSIRGHVVKTADQRLVKAYNSCWTHLLPFARSTSAWLRLTFTPK